MQARAPPRGRTTVAGLPPQHPPPHRRRSLLPLFRDLGMLLLAMAGAACLLWLVLSNIFGLSLITFATGSMAPTIPTGSLAVVREIPASELQVGDVATLLRGGERLPVTHRVLEVTQSPDDAETQIVSMQGDANPIPDTFPYYVDTAKVVLWSVPNGAYVIGYLTSPVVLMVLTVGIGSLVLWAFWPKRGKQAARAASPEPERESELVSER
jgi:signal peptidase